ncbi:MAG: polysaccharide pyruvyl transferase family protein [Flavobacteriales bacterium]|nr:polysaccharide pyruvyl transferase family protein [Flavobacteriales bacterium]MCB9365486.1 polysaccharide pyruvyl transferase family protein [Flavobacteriales bacterium]
MKKTMIIGLGPEYNYPKKISKWFEADTKYASNHGASLISRAIAKQFNGEHVEIDEFNKVNELREKYDQCIIAFATHVTNWRDVSIYTNFIEKLNLPTFAFSLGVQDYAGATSSVLKLHPSMKRLLEIVSDRSKYIGVRGNYTASILYKNGFKNVMPVGCPTVYWNLHPNLEIHKPETINNPAIVYHRTLSQKEGIHLLKDIPLIGQDFLDEVVFTKNLEDDVELKKSELAKYTKDPNGSVAIGLIDKNGIFHYSFQEWFDYVKSKDFILGARLHGCIGALIQGVPAVLLARDLRVKEIAEFFNIPVVNYEDLNKKISVKQIFQEADYSAFNRTYKLRYNNYIKFLNENKLESKLDISSLKEDFLFNHQDLRANLSILNTDIQGIKEELDSFKEALKTADAMHKLLDKLPLADKIAKGLRK